MFLLHCRICDHFKLSNRIDANCGPYISEAGKHIGHASKSMFKTVKLNAPWKQSTLTAIAL